MTRVDFHSKVPDKLAYACRLIRKARASKMQVVVFLEDQAQLSQFDDMLWSFSEQDFLPHVTATDPLAAQTPIILTDNAEADLPHHEIMINLSTKIPEHFARFTRLFEIVSTEETDLTQGRDRYRLYQQRGYPLTNFMADKS